MRKGALVEMAAQLQVGDADAVRRILRGKDVGTLRRFLRGKWQDVMEQANLTSFCDVAAWDAEYDADDAAADDDDDDGGGSDDEEAGGSGEEEEEED